MKTLEGGVEGEECEVLGACLEEGGRRFFFFFFLFILYIREGLMKKGELEGMSRREVQKHTTRQQRFSRGGKRGGLLLVGLWVVWEVVVVVGC